MDEIDTWLAAFERRLIELRWRVMERTYGEDDEGMPLIRYCLRGPHWPEGTMLLVGIRPTGDLGVAWTAAELAVDLWHAAPSETGGICRQ